MISKQDQKLVARFDGSAPRYTSYPTAPHFSAEVGEPAYRDWIARLPQTASVSLYTHIPYCGALCWFCACRSQGVRSYAPVERYLEHLEKEIRALAPLVGERPVRQMHWGGGSPTVLTPDDLKRLSALQRELFNVADDAEFCVEIDPRDMTAERLDALAESGLTRASLGVQDFNPEVQKCINRDQSFEKTREIIDGLRARGLPSVNIDALYGLPHQTLERLQRTIDGVVALSPDRVALFGYAHVPWMAKRQKLIPEEALPDVEERFAQAQEAAARLTAAGYVRVGLDHFAKPGDDLAKAAEEGRLRRNFQGYTTDVCDALLGVGASAISRTPFGFAQNVAATAAYQEQVEKTGLAIARGVSLSLDDRLRGDAIEMLMCQLRLDIAALRARYGDFADVLVGEAAQALAELPAGLVEPDGEGLRVTEAGRPLLRSIAARFDAYLTAPAARYSRAI